MGWLDDLMGAGSDAKSKATQLQEALKKRQQERDAEYGGRKKSPAEQEAIDALQGSGN